MKAKKLMTISMISLMATLTGCSTSTIKDSSNAGLEGNATVGIESPAPTEGEQKEDTSAQFPKTITHGMGELTIEKKPERIASADVMITDYLLVLDELPVISEGATTGERSDIFAKYLGDREMINLGSQANMETLVSSTPDIILMSSTSKKVAKFDQYNEVADTVVVDFSIGVRERLRSIAQIVGKEEKAEEVIAEFDLKVEEAKKIADAHKDETVLFLVSYGKDFKVLHPEEFPVYYKEIGLTPVDNLPEEVNGRIGVEALSELNPDHIFICESRRDMTEERFSLINVWQENPVWKGLKAVKNNQIYAVDTLVGDTFFLGQVAGIEAISENLGNK